MGAVTTGAETTLGLPVWLEIAAMGVSGFFGAVIAVNRGAPFLGVLIGGLVVGLGGGVVRDVLLNTMPVAIGDWYFIPAVGIAAIAGGFSGRFLAQSRLSIVGIQAVSLGLLVVIGAEKALLFGVSLWAVVVLAIITASAGGAMLDALSGVRSGWLSQGGLHLTSLALGAAGFIVLRHLASNLVAETGTVALVAILRVASFKCGWGCPEFPKSGVS